MRAVDDGLGTIHIFTGTKSNGKQFQELMKDYRYLEQEIVDLKKELFEEKKKDKEIERLKRHILMIKEAIETWNIKYREGTVDFEISQEITSVVWSDKE